MTSSGSLIPANAQRPEADEILETWAAIAGYIHTSVRNAQRIKGLPVSGGGRGRPVWAYKRDLDAWRASPRNAVNPPNATPNPTSAPTDALNSEPEPASVVQDSSSGATAAAPAVQTETSPLFAYTVPLSKRLVTAVVLVVFLMSVVLRTAPILTLASETPVQLTRVRLTTNSAEAPIMSAAISADGNTVAYTDGRNVHVRPADLPNPKRLPDSAITNYLSVDWFPGTHTLLVSGIAGEKDKPSLWAVPISGDGARELRKDVEAGAVSPDGSRIAFVTDDGRQIGVMGPNGENPRLIAAAGDEDTYNELAWLSDGKWLAAGRLHLGGFQLDVSIDLIPPEGGRPRTIVSDGSLRSMCMAPNGRIIYAKAEPAPNESDVNLWEIRIDSRAGEKVGEARRITDWVDSSIHGLSMSADGTRLIFLKGPYSADAYVGELTENGTRLLHVVRLTKDDADDLPTSLTRDGKTVYIHSDRSGTWQIYNQPIDGGSPELVVTGTKDYRGARLTPHGDRLLYFEYPKSGRWTWLSPVRLMALSLIGGGPPMLVWEQRFPYSVRCGYSTADRCVLGERGLFHVIFYALNVATGDKRELARAYVGPSLKRYLWDVSPDGSRIAIIMDEWSGIAIIRVVSLKGEPDRDVRIQGWHGFQSIDWSTEGNGWYVSSRSGRGAVLLYIDANDGRVHVLRRQPGSFGTWGVPSPDGRRLAFLEWTSAANIWMATDAAK